MAIIQSGAVPTNLLTVDPTFAAMRVSDHPPEILGAYSLGLVSGALTTVAAGGVVFALRWAPTVNTQLCMIRRVEIGFATTTAFTTAQTITYSMQVARNFSVSYTSGGTAAAFTQANTGKLRTSMPASAFSAPAGQLYMANTGVISGATNTLDTQVIGYVTSPSTTAVVGSSMLSTPIFQHSPGDYPLILANNEGFVINNVIVMGAGGVINLYVTVDWMEMNATTGNAIAY